MKKFETPIAEIEKFQIADIITTSGGGDDDYVQDENEMPAF